MQLCYTYGQLFHFYLQIKRNEVVFQIHIVARSGQWFSRFRYFTLKNSAASIQSGQTKKAACRRLQNGGLARRLNAAKGLLLLDAVLEAVLGLQGFHLILGVLNEGRLIHAVAVVGLLVVLQNLGQLASGFVLRGLCHLLGELDDVLAMFGNACFHGNFSFYWFNRCAVQTVPGPPSSRPNTRRALAAVRVSSSSSGTSSSRASTAAVWAISPESFRLPRKGTGAI